MQLSGFEEFLLGRSDTALFVKSISASDRTRSEINRYLRINLGNMLIHWSAAQTGSEINRYLQMSPENRLTHWSAAQTGSDINWYL